MRGSRRRHMRRSRNGVQPRGQSMRARPGVRAGNRGRKRAVPKHLPQPGHPHPLRPGGRRMRLPPRRGRRQLPRTGPHPRHPCDRSPFRALANPQRRNPPARQGSRHRGDRGRPRALDYEHRLRLRRHPKLQARRPRFRPSPPRLTPNFRTFPSSDTTRAFPTWAAGATTEPRRTPFTESRFWA